MAVSGAELRSPAAGDLRPGRVEEPAPGHGDQPALRIPRKVGRPDADRLDQLVLDGVLVRREACSAADEVPKRTWRAAPKRASFT